MSQLALKVEPNNPFGGVVLTSEGKGWKRDTGVFVPDPGMLGGPKALSVILWFHGHRVKDIPHLFYKENTKLLEGIVSARRRVVFVAPHLGNSKEGAYAPGALGGGSTTQKYLDDVLGALTAWYVSTLKDADPDKATDWKFQIADLYVAGHSGGGDAIRSSVAALGTYKEQLRECWAFDCLYSAGEVWNQWARARGGIPLYFYFGDGTQPAYNGDVLGFWRLVYGTLRNPLLLGARALNVYLAPALQGAEMDMVAFQHQADLQRKNVAGNRYEEVRKKVDPYLHNTTLYWSTILKEGLMEHYAVVANLLGPRISQSIYD